MTTANNHYLKWFCRLIFIGIVINLSFAIPALFAAQFLTTLLGLPNQAIYPWLNNVGMLLIGVSLFYIPAALAPERWFAYSWLTVISRFIAVVFWYWLANTSGYPDTFLPLLCSDGLLFVLLGLTLQLGLPEEGKASISNLYQLISAFACKIAHSFSKLHVQVTVMVSLLFVSFIAYTAWDNLLRQHPDPVFDNAEEHFKYGAIGLSVENRIPLYIFDAMPKVCSNIPGGVSDWRELGFVFEPGKALPIGLAQRQIGYPSVEATCSMCHTGQYQKTTKDALTPILAGSANTLDLERFQWFMYNCAASENFTSGKVLAEIEKTQELGLIESLYYRLAIIPIIKKQMGQQESQYKWQKLRPRQGPGRTDTFNPTKMVIFHFPDDSTIGTVDLPQIWNQKPREGMWLHWDGNNNAITERNYAAAMAVGATPDSVLVDSFKQITDWLLTKEPAKFPYVIDQQKALSGKAIWDAECAECHEFGKKSTGQVTTNIQELGTDRYRLDSFTTGLVDKFHDFKQPPFDFLAYRKTASYSNTPTDGIWARAPYLHNGSVPTLWDLLLKPEQRPKKFFKGYSVYDPEKVGFVSTGVEAEQNAWLFDTHLLGNSNSGHLYGTELDEQNKWQLIEYMKTL